jgi:hypothetical protein
MRLSTLTDRNSALTARRAARNWMVDRVRQKAACLVLGSNTVPCVGTEVLMRELTVERYVSRKKKPGPTARYRAKRRRAEGPVAKSVREKCVDRDSYCRIGSPYACTDDVFDPNIYWASGCSGSSEWCHMHSRRRSQTRNQAPEVRHDTKHSFMACQKHHDQYDGRQSPRLFVTTLTAKGADGPLKFRRGQ